MKLFDLVTEYVTYKQALGMRFETESNELAAFCRRLGDVPIQSVTVDQVQAYLDGDNPVSSYWARKSTALRGLFRFALARGYSATLPLPLYRPKLPPPLVPYIYSNAELKSLLDVTLAACGPRVPLPAYVLRALILLLYGACLRHGEALRLTMKDVDLECAVLCIRETKFYKTRLVPMGEHLSIAMKQYAQQRNLDFAQGRMPRSSVSATGAH
jgi:site-specific recombinase XerD